MIVFKLGICLFLGGNVNTASRKSEGFSFRTPFSYLPLALHPYDSASLMIIAHDYLKRSLSFRSDMVVKGFFHQRNIIRMDELSPSNGLVSQLVLLIP